jgi:hypothetical protein
MSTVSKNALKFAEQFSELKPGGIRDMRDSIKKNISLVESALSSGRAVFGRLAWNGWPHIVSGRQNRTVHDRGQQRSLALPKGRDKLHSTWLDILQFLRKFGGSLKLVGCPEYQQAAMLVILYRKWVAEEDSKRMLVGTVAPVVVETVVETDAEREARDALEEAAFEKQALGEEVEVEKMEITIELSDDEEWD